MAVVPPEAGFELPLSGGAPGQATADSLRYGALKVPLLRSRLAGHLVRHSTTAAPSPLVRTLPWAVAIAGALALILAGGFVHFHASTVEPRQPYVALDSIEAWLRHMTIIRAPTPDLSPLEAPEGL